MNNSEICRDKSVRRRDIRQHTDAAGEPDLNGLDYVELDERDTTNRTLKLYFLGKAPEYIQAENVRIEGGTRIRHLQVLRDSITICQRDSPEEDDCLRLRVDKTGDFSIYTLRLVNARDGRPGDEPLDGFDPRYAHVKFSFKANCANDLDCLPPKVCAPAALPEPEINYLAKDYASFRQLILDRLALIMPGWQERHVPDIGIALVELLAHTGDYLSYYQDAVATEAYLDTARQRISVRRHATLVDYQMHEGCNARAWVCINTSADLALDDPRDLFFITGSHLSLGTNSRVLNLEDIRNVPANRYDVFEPLGHKPRWTINLYEAHNKIRFYTWKERECCLPRGATTATLLDEWILPEPPASTYTSPYANQYESIQMPTLPLGHDEPDERQPAHDDSQHEEERPSHRSELEERDYRIRQKGANYEQGYAPPRPEKYGSYQQTPDEQTTPQRERKLHLAVGDVLIFEEVKGLITGDEDDADPSHRHAVRLTKVELSVDTLYDVPVVEIEWSREDELPFPLCISTVGRAPGCEYLEDISVARGNVILCDHGRTIKSVSWDVPAATEEDAGCFGPQEPRETILKSARFRPRLNRTPLTHRVSFPSPSFVARAQAQYLEQLLPDVHARIREHWRKTRSGEPLTPEQFNELVTIFGRRTLKQVGLREPGAKVRSAQSIEEQAAALGHLLRHQERYLSQKARRLRVLRRRALAGYVLSSREKDEIGEMFGASFMAGVASGRMLGPASEAMKQSPRDALPVVKLSRLRPSELGEQTTPAPVNDWRERWMPQRNLLGSGSRDRHFVAEIDNEGYAHLRFGDGELGRAPTPNSTLRATYRIGNGKTGNVGADTISHIVFNKTRLSGITLSARNPLPAEGGSEPEPMEEVKLFAPGTFRRELQRAITADDYSRLAERDRSETVQKAASSLRWAGSWYAMRVAVDPLASLEAEQGLLDEIKSSLHRYRRIGHDVMVLPARYVPLEIELTVCVLPNYLRGHVKAELLAIFSNRVLQGGRRGLFHPDNLTFGDDIYLSKLVAAAQAVEGVETVSVRKLQRFGEGPRQEIEEGVLPLSPLEVARLDSDPSFPERGKIVLNVRGGR